HGFSSVFAITMSGATIRQVLPDLLESDRLTQSTSDYVGLKPPSPNHYQVSNYSLAAERDSGFGQVQIQTYPAIGFPIAFTLSDPTQPVEAWLFRGRFAGRVS